MTNHVQYISIISIAYMDAGIAPPRNPSLIIMILFPEYPLLVARGRPCLTLGKENQTR